MRILFLCASAFLVLTISALLILPIALRVTLLMLLTVVLMLVIAALTRILLLRVRLVGVILTLFVTHHFHSLQAQLPEAPEVLPEGEVEGLHALYKKATPANGG